MTLLFLTMSRINYNLRLIRAFVFDVDGVLSPNTIPMGADGIPARMVNIKDGYAMQLAVKHNYKIAIITGADAIGIRSRYASLGITDVYMKASEKLPILEQWMSDNGLSPAEVAYAGDDIPDLPCMSSVGLSVAPSDGADDVKEIATYVTPCAGGYGVARDIIEQVMRVRGDWMWRSTAFGW